MLHVLDFYICILSKIKNSNVLEPLNIILDIGILAVIYFIYGCKCLWLNECRP